MSKNLKRALRYKDNINSTLPTLEKSTEKHDMFSRKDDVLLKKKFYNTELDTFKELQEKYKYLQNIANSDINYYNEMNSNIAYNDLANYGKTMYISPNTRISKKTVKKKGGKSKKNRSKKHLN